MVARRSCLHGDVAAVADVDVTGLALLGGDDDDARLGLRSVDGSGGSVLQHGDALNVLRSNAGHAVGVEGGKVARTDIHVAHRRDVLLQGHTVDHPQRLVVAGDGGRTAYADFGRLARAAADGLHVDARQLALHEHVDVGQWLVLQLLVGEDAYGAGRLADVGL